MSLYALVDVMHVSQSPAWVIMCKEDCGFGLWFHSNNNKYDLIYK